MTFPDELLYTKDHEWIRLEGDVAEVGITDFAQNELGDIVYVDIHAVGSHVEHGAVFGTIEAVKTVSDLYMPATGEVLEVNADLNNNPELVNADPYTGGWLVRIRLKDAANREGLLSADAYKELIGA